MTFKPRVVKDDEPAPEYDQDVVDALHDALRRAQAGEIKSVLILMEDSDGGYASSVCTESALALFTYARLAAEDEIRDLMSMGPDLGTMH
jgi:hypothetical protein